MRKFFVVGLPRSRTFWLAEFLGCLHDGFYYFPQYEDFMESEHVGDSTTCYMFIKDLIHDERKVIIHRDINEVRESLRGLFGDIDLSSLEETEKELKKASGLHVNFEDIDDRIHEIWHHCRGDKPFPVEKYDRMKDTIMNNEFMIEETRRCLKATGS